LAALQGIDAVRAFGEYPLARTERPAFVPGQRREIRRPVGIDVIGSENVLAASLGGHSRERARTALLSKSVRARQSDCEAGTEGPEQRGVLTHHLLRLDRHYSRCVARHVIPCHTG